MGTNTPKSLLLYIVWCHKNISKIIITINRIFECNFALFLGVCLSAAKNDFAIVVTVLNAEDKDFVLP